MMSISLRSFSSHDIIFWNFPSCLNAVNLVYVNFSLETLETPNIELHPLLPSEQPQFIEARTLQGVENIPQGCWPMLTPIRPTIVSNWLNVLWVVDHSWYTQETAEREKPSSISVSLPSSSQFTLTVCHTPGVWLGGRKTDGTAARSHRDAPATICLHRDNTTTQLRTQHISLKRRW